MIHASNFESRGIMDDDGGKRECRGRKSPKLSTGAQALPLLLRFAGCGLSSACVNAPALRRFLYWLQAVLPIGTISP
jgi:hypothetical protein